MNTLSGGGSATPSSSGTDHPRTVGLEPADARMRYLGEGTVRYGLAAIFLWIGWLKFADDEARNIEPMLSNSLLWSWAVQSMGAQSVAHFIGTVEFVIALLIAARSFSPRLCAIGSAGAIITFVATLTFMFTTPGVWEPGYGFARLSALQCQFLVKDIVLLSGAIWTAGEALGAVNHEASPGASSHRE